eukprot:EG_transcript_35903
MSAASTHPVSMGVQTNLVGSLRDFSATLSHLPQRPPTEGGGPRPTGVITLLPAPQARHADISLASRRTAQSEERLKATGRPGEMNRFEVRGRIDARLMMASITAD